MRTGRVKGIVSPMWCRRLLISKMSPNPARRRLLLTTPWQVRDCILQREVCVCELVQPSKGDGGRTYISAVEDFSSLARREGELRSRERSLQTAGRLSETSKRGRRSTRWKSTKAAARENSLRPALGQKAGSKWTSDACIGWNRTRYASIGRPPVVATTSISGSFASAARVGIIS